MFQQPVREGKCFVLLIARWKGLPQQYHSDTDSDSFVLGIPPEKQCHTTSPCQTSLKLQAA